MEAKYKINCYKSAIPGKQLYTCNLSNGTTPLMIRYNDLNYHSQYYIVSHREVVIDLFWYRPSKEKFLTLDKPTQDHILNGGLIYDEYNDVAILKHDETSLKWDYERFQDYMLKIYGSLENKL